MKEVKQINSGGDLLMKIRIIGCPGSGKTYISKLLAKKYQLIHLDLDDIFWEKETFKKRNVQERNNLIDEILKKKSLIIEGVYYREWTLKTFSESDLIFFLNVNRFITTYRLVVRFLKRRFSSERKESVLQFYNLLKWSNRYNKNKKEIINLIKKENQNFFIVKSLDEVDKKLHERFS